MQTALLFRRIQIMDNAHRGVVQDIASLAELWHEVGLSVATRNISRVTICIIQDGTRTPQEGHPLRILWISQSFACSNNHQRS